MMRWWWLGAVLVVACHGDLSGPVRVIDGDTIVVAGTHVRLAGIDAPERAQTCRAGGREVACGREATAALHRLIGDARVTCQGHGYDRYRRLIATCWAGNLELNRAMVRDGQAVAYRRYSLAYVADEDWARAHHVGLWAGDFENPEAFRHRKRKD
jgi:endonuclease YncB( thermonuclease family)